jgi:hypothetical protein
MTRRHAMMLYACNYIARAHLASALAVRAVYTVPTALNRFCLNTHKHYIMYTGTNTATTAND